MRNIAYALWSVGNWFGATPQEKGKNLLMSWEPQKKEHHKRKKSLGSVCPHGRKPGREETVGRWQRRHSIQGRPTAGETARLRGENIVRGEREAMASVIAREKKPRELSGNYRDWEHWQDGEGECGSVATFRDVPTVDFLVRQNSLSRFFSCL
jgi:hypothetical protein